MGRHAEYWRAEYGAGRGGEVKSLYAAHDSGSFRKI
jgi:hypothetical protein